MQCCQGCSLVLNVSVSRQSRDVVSKRLGLVEMWEDLGLDLVSDWKWNVSVSYHRVSFTSQYAQLFASLQIARTSFWMQGVYIVHWFTSLLIYCNASAWDWV